MPLARRRITIGLLCHRRQQTVIGHQVGKRLIPAARGVEVAVSLVDRDPGLHVCEGGTGDFDFKVRVGALAAAAADLILRAERACCRLDVLVGLGTFVFESELVEVERLPQDLAIVRPLLVAENFFNAR